MALLRLQRTVYKECLPNNARSTLTSRMWRDKQFFTWFPVTLTTMEVSLRIANMLGLADELLDLTLSRVLDVSKIPVPLADLPENLRPTEAQLILPHYPVIDVLPWPSVRTRLICLFNQPDRLRPLAARGSMARYYAANAWY